MRFMFFGCYCNCTSKAAALVLLAVTSVFIVLFVCAFNNCKRLKLKSKQWRCFVVGNVLMFFPLLLYRHDFQVPMAGCLCYWSFEIVIVNLPSSLSLLSLFSRHIRHATAHSLAIAVFYRMIFFSSSNFHDCNLT